MNKQKKIGVGLIVSAILAGIIFYIVLFTISKWFPVWTGRTLSNEWVLVLVSAVPLIVVVIFLIVERINKAKFRDLEFEFGETIPQNLIEPVELESELVRKYLTKGGQLELERLLRNIRGQSTQPRILIVPLDHEGRRISFVAMREYIYELSRIAPVEYVVFLDDREHYLGFITVEKFKARFPKFGIELLTDDRKFREVNIPLFQNINEDEWLNTVNRLIKSQWDPERENDRVRIADLDKIGATDIKAYSYSPVERIYWLLVENNLIGIPIVDKGMNFVGIATQEKIAKTVILRLIEKASSREI